MNLCFLFGFLYISFFVHCVVWGVFVHFVFVNVHMLSFFAQFLFFSCFGKTKKNPQKTRGVFYRCIHHPKQTRSVLRPAPRHQTPSPTQADPGRRGPAPPDATPHTHGAPGHATDQKPNTPTQMCTQIHTHLYGHAQATRAIRHRKPSNTGTRESPAPNPKGPGKQFPKPGSAPWSHCNST